MSSENMNASTYSQGATELGLEPRSDFRACVCGRSNWLVSGFPWPLDSEVCPWEGLESHSVLLSQAVLLADILPTLVIKLLAPLGLHLLPYRSGSGWQRGGQEGKGCGGRAGS